MADYIKKVKSPISVPWAAFMALMKSLWIGKNNFIFFYGFFFFFINYAK